jgi:Domain of unknown function (DUF6968)
MKPNFEIRRTVHFKMAGRTTEGELVIGNLRKVRSKGKRDVWACSWMLSETDPKPKDIYGEDALSALLNCFAFLSSYIRNYGHADVQIWWLEKGDNAGLTLRI